MKIGKKEAVFMLIGASTFLLLLFFFMQYLVQILTILICFFACSCFAILGEELASLLDIKNGEVNLPLLGQLKHFYLLGFLLGLITVISWYFTQNWLLCNLIACSFCLVSLKTIEIESLPPGVLLLSLLFFYDIFMVFITPYLTTSGESIMLYVASNLDLPIKIQMPHLTIDYPSASCSLIGLGDIVIPGIYISYVSRFGKQVSLTDWYFVTQIIAYSLALFICGIALWVYGVGQPALLYIVPFLFIATFVTAYMRGEIRDIWAGNNESKRQFKEAKENGYQAPEQIEMSNLNK